MSGEDGKCRACNVKDWQEQEAGPFLVTVCGNCGEFTGVRRADGEKIPPGHHVIDRPSTKDLGVRLETAKQSAHYRLMASEAMAGPRWRDGTGAHLEQPAKAAAHARAILDREGACTMKAVLTEHYYDVVSAEPDSDELLMALVGLETVVRQWIESKIGDSLRVETPTRPRPSGSLELGARLRQAQSATQRALREMGGEGRS